MQIRHLVELIFESDLKFDQHAKIHGRNFDEKTLKTILIYK